MKKQLPLYYLQKKFIIYTKYYKSLIENALRRKRKIIYSWDIYKQKIVTKDTGKLPVNFDFNKNFNLDNIIPKFLLPNSTSQLQSLH